MNETDFTYIGAELDLFALAVNWKRYWGWQIAPYLGRRVLEVGAGIGGTTSVLCQGDYDAWVGLEPDAQMVRELQAAQAAGKFPPHCDFRVGTVADLAETALFDSILYIDVLEHIEDDAAEVARAARHLAPGGSLIVLSPAFQFLFSEFDAAIGHYRRYTRSTLAALAPASCQSVYAVYLDSLATVLSIGNKLMLRAPQPTEQQILLWDQVIVPLSIPADRLFGYRFGRSVLQVWQRDSDQ